MLKPRAHLPRGLALLLVACLLSSTAQAQIEITLKNSFIQQFRNRATIDADFTVDKAHKRVNPPSKDGDMHIAGRSPQIGLATVAEIMNAKFEKPSVQLIKSVEGTGQTVRMTGVWRLWMEHSGGGAQIQGAKLEAFDTTNPDHVFEIHPITALNGTPILNSLIPIKDYVTKDAEKAFTTYESLDCQIKPLKNTTRLVTEMGGFNYVEFNLKINSDKPFVVEDGRFLFASVYDLNGGLLVRNLRMVFAKDTPPEMKARTLKKGDALHVVGIPRINLDLVAWRIANAKRKPEILGWNLPYEIIVAGIYDDVPRLEEEAGEEET